jgi:hypothetical protein
MGAGQVTPPLPAGFVLDSAPPPSAPPLPAGFVLDGARKPQHAEWSDVPKAALQQTKDLLGGLARGAGSIGATLLAPQDMLEDAISRRLTGNQPKVSRNQQRRQDMTDATASLGADPESLTYGASKLGAEIAGTAGTGNVLAGLAKASPLATRAPNVIEALGTAGMRGGSLPARVAGGAVAGGAAAGLVNPEDALTGAAVGGALPPALAGAGAAGRAIGAAIRGPEQSPQLRAAIQSAQGAGYVIPPSQARPTLMNRALEGFSGKITTAQNASARNQVVTNRLAAEALGLPTDTPITIEALQGVRETAGRAYAQIGSTGVVKPGQAYFDALDKIAEPFKLTAGAFPGAAPSPVIGLVDSLRSPAFASASAVEKIKQLRTAADDAFRSGSTDIGLAARSAAKAMEDALEAHLLVIGEPQRLQAFRDARQLIAKTYTVEEALNKSSGAVDARKLAANLQKGKPLSGELKTAAEFAGQFPKAAQTVEAMGSLPQTSPLDWLFSGGASMAASNPLPMLGVLARPAARATVLSPVVQGRLLQSQNPISGLLGPDLQQLGYRAAPIVAGPSADR